MMLRSRMVACRVDERLTAGMILWNAIQQQAQMLWTEMWCEKENPRSDWPLRVRWNASCRRMDLWRLQTLCTRQAWEWNNIASLLLRRSTRDVFWSVEVAVRLDFQSNQARLVRHRSVAWYHTANLSQKSQNVCWFAAWPTVFGRPLQARPWRLSCRKRIRVRKGLDEPLMRNLWICWMLEIAIADWRMRQMAKYSAQDDFREKGRSSKKKVVEKVVRISKEPIYHWSAKRYRWSDGAGDFVT